ALATGASMWSAVVFAYTLIQGDAVADERATSARSSHESALNRPITAPMARCPAPSLTEALNVPSPLPNITVEKPSRLAKARSGNVSLFTSPIATETGLLVLPVRTRGANVPSPLARNTDTLPADVVGATRSAWPSPFKSAIATIIGSSVPVESDAASENAPV